MGKIHGKNVFIPYAIPGELLEVEIAESKNDYDLAHIKKILKPSPLRITPPCQYYEICGGCNMMHIQGGQQRKMRSQMLQELFVKNGIELSNGVQEIYGPDYGYRSRFQLTDGGLSQKKSNTIIPIEKCLCAEESINKYLEGTKMQEREKGRVHLFGSEFMTNPSNVDVVISQEISKKTDVRSAPSKGKKHKIKENHYFSGTVFSPEHSVTVRLLEKNISFDVRGFFQSNLFVFSKVLSLIQDLLPGGKSILDMYAGCGAISAFLADKYEQTVLVEHNRDAIVYAEQNLAGKKHVSYGMSGSAWVKNCAQACPAFDACFIDPPRSGMERETCDFLCRSKIPLILSMSCDPTTHARDCARLIKSGYILKDLYLLDFYPNTSHIESLAVLEKA